MRERSACSTAAQERIQGGSTALQAIKILERQYTKLKQQTNVLDAPRSGRTPKVPSAQVDKVLSALLKDRKLGTKKGALWQLEPICARPPTGKKY